MSAARPSAARGSRAAPAAVLAVLAVAGAGTMAVELAAVRLLAPWFGTSLAVWTNVIGVVLLALSLGYLAGARLAPRPRPLARLGAALCVGGAATAWLPTLAGPVAGAFVPAGLSLGEAAPVVLWGSLAASLVLFLAPAALLGAASPLAVEAIAELRGIHAGAAGGRVLAASTLGSLAGVFGTSHVLVPRLGVGASFLAAGAALALAGAFALLFARPRGAGRALATAAPALALLAALAGGPRTPKAGPGVELLAARESPYQSVRVVEHEGPEGRPLRLLQVNEHLDSFQSVWQPEPGLLPEGHYYDLFVLPLWWERPDAADVLVLGLGAGTTWRVLEGASPPGTELRLDGVELDPVVVALGRAWMDLPPDGERHRSVTGVDARVALRALERSYELVVLDAYANQFEIPPHLATVEFLREVRARLAPGGWLAVNVGGFGFEDPVVAAVAATAAEAFGAPVAVARVPAARNFVVFAREGGGPLPVAGGALALPEGEVGRALAPLAVPGAARVVEPGAGLVLTDDRNPLDRLELRSIRGAALGG